MAKMVPVTMGNQQGWYINLDLVRAIQPTNPDASSILIRITLCRSHRRRD
jgi:hypothetical protein